MAPLQGKTRADNVSLAFGKKGRNIGKWLQFRFSQVQTIAHSKRSNYSSDASSGRRKSSTVTHLPAENQLSAIMNADEQEFDLPLQPSQPNLYANLPPPPPPPPQSAVSPLVRAATPGEQIDELNERRRAHEFHEIEKQHDELMAARDDLIRCRSQMKMDRKKIREIREKAGAQEGSVINQLRTFLHKKDITLPRDIEETFELTDALRDQLGLLEAGYDDFEEDYTRKEIKHNGKEMHFIEKLGSVHSRCPAAPTFMQIRTNADTVDRAPVPSTRDWEVIKHSNEDPDAALSEKALQLVVQKKVHPEAEEVDELQERDLVLFANKANVDDWLVNTLFQSPIHLEESNQDSHMGKTPEEWYWLGTIGAQFRDEEVEDSHVRSKEHDSALSSNGTASYGKPVLVLHTKKVRPS